MRYTLVFLILALFSGFTVGFFVLSRGQSEDVFIDGLGTIELRKARWTGSDREAEGKIFLEKLYRWYVLEELIPHNNDMKISKTISQSIKNSPAIVVSHGKIPYKKFWIPVLSRPALIGLERDGVVDIELYSLPNMDEIRIDFVEGIWQN